MSTVSNLIGDVLARQDHHLIRPSVWDPRFIYTNPHSKVQDSPSSDDGGAYYADGTNNTTVHHRSWHSCKSKKAVLDEEIQSQVNLLMDGICDTKDLQEMEPGSVFYNATYEICRDMISSVLPSLLPLLPLITIVTSSRYLINNYVDRYTPCYSPLSSPETSSMIYDRKRETPRSWKCD